METIKFEEVNFEEVKEVEEVVTPGWGAFGCCN